MTSAAAPMAYSSFDDLTCTRMCQRGAGAGTAAPHWRDTSQSASAACEQRSQDEANDTCGNHREQGLVANEMRGVVNSAAALFG